MRSGHATAARALENSSMPNPSVIEVRNASRIYGPPERPVRALEDVSFEIGKHEFVAITGPSGSGKSTLLHLLGGLDRPDQGSVHVAGVNLAAANDSQLTHYRRTQLGIVFQFFHLLPTMTLIENVALPLLLAGQRFDTVRPRALELLEMVRMQDRSTHFPHQLSGGEMQRGAIARALIHKPEVLLADEPTGNLDSASAELVMEVLQKIASSALITMVVVTHSDDVSRTAARRIQMRDGRVFEDNQT